MIRRFAVASLLTVASAAALSPNAFAQTAPGETSTITLTAENAVKCILANGSSSITTNGNNAGLATQLTGAGSVSARCNKAVTSTTTITALGNTPQTTLSPVTPQINIPSTGAPTQVPFSFTATVPGSVLPSGSYAYDVVVSVTY